MDNQIYHFVYLTTNLINNRIYVGVHSTYDLDDGYLGSGKALKLAVKKYGEHNFTRSIIHLCLTEQHVYDWESLIVDTEFVARKDTYNIRIGGKGGCMTKEYTEEEKSTHSEKISKGMYARQYHPTKETIDKTKQTILERYGSRYTQQFANVELQSLRRKEIWASMSDEDRTIFGQKISTAKIESGCSAGSRNSQAKHWKLYSPTGQEFDVIGNLAEFCSTHKLHCKILRTYRNTIISLDSFKTKKNSIPELLANTLGWSLCEL